MSLIGLTGSHRTGKTTLARRFAEVSGYSLVETSTSAILRNVDIDPREDYPLERRLLIQRYLLDCLEGEYVSHRNFAITDRTPIDLLAYLLADVRRTNVTDKVGQQVERYIADCYQVTRENFAGVVIVQPGIPVVEDESKAPGVASYMEHINLLCLGAIATGRLGDVKAYSLSRSCIDVDERAECLVNIAAEIPYPVGFVTIEQKLPM